MHNSCDDGTLTVVCNNFPEDAVAVKITLYPAETTYTPELLHNREAAEGFTLSRPGKTKALVNRDDLRNPATFSGGEHLVVIKVFTKKLQTSEAATSVVIDGDTMLDLDYSRLELAK
jgi:hypothetical protein